MGWVAEVCICPCLQAASGQEVGRSYGAAWTRPKAGCVGKNQRHLIWSLSLKKRKYQNRPKFVSWKLKVGAQPFTEGCEPHIQALAIGGKELPPAPTPGHGSFCEWIS